MFRLVPLSGVFITKPTCVSPRLSSCVSGCHTAGALVTHTHTHKLLQRTHTQIPGTGNDGFTWASTPKLALSTLSSSPTALPLSLCTLDSSLSSSLLNSLSCSHLHSPPLYSSSISLRSSPCSSSFRTHLKPSYGWNSLWKSALIYTPTQKHFHLCLYQLFWYVSC